MENNMFGAPMGMVGQSSSVLNEIPQTENPLIQGYSFDQTRIMNGISILAGMQGEEQLLSNNVHFDVPLMNPPCIVNPTSLVPYKGKNILGDTPLGNNTVFQDQQAVATNIPASLSAIPAARFGLQENLEKPPACSTSLSSLEALAPYILSNWQNNPNTVLPTFGDRMYDYPSSSNTNPDGWTSSNAANLTHHSYDYPNFINELSLNLATSPTTGQCSEVSSDSLEQASCSSKGVSGNLSSHRHVNFQQAILGSRYLTGIQEILAQIARYSLDNTEKIYFSTSTSCSRGITEDNATKQVHPSMFEAPENSSFALHDESRKSQLLTLLQMVDSRYNQCLDEIHTVVSAFHAATELDQQVHAQFALKTISILYKDLRDRISNYIISMGEIFNNSHSEEEDKERSTEALFIEKHWALQQFKRKEHQIWRPQRGLPERSVSVLRTWMFQNFLHPYPKDSEKQLLAVKSGLTRSQVSNWFINARVRLWKPLIEEMYAEMNRRKDIRNDEGRQGSQRRSGVLLSNQRFAINS